MQLTANSLIPQPRQVDMHTSTALSSSYSLQLAQQGSSRRRVRHAHVRARVATLERKETFRADGAHEPTMQASVDVLRSSIEQLEASYQRSPVQRNLSQLPTAPELVQSAGPRHAHARQLKRARRWSLSASIRTAPILEASREAAQAMSLNEADIGAGNAEALRTIMSLWHQLQQKHQENEQRANSSRGLNWWENDPPRLLTADEERILGTVVQQQRRLQQLYQQHPDVAANLRGPVAPSLLHASSSSHHASEHRSDNHNSSSSSGQNSSNNVHVASTSSSSKHGNTLWPPPLRKDEIAELCGMSVAWRAMLPGLAEMAQQLLVSYNVKLVLHMRKYSYCSTDIPWQDVLQSGLAGLIVGAERYDPARKTRFSTVAGLWILQALNRTASKQTGSILLPDRHMNIFAHVLQTFGSQAVADIDHRPDVVSKISATFSIRPKTVLRIIKSASSSYLAGSLDAPSYQGPTGSKGEEGLLPWSAMVTSDDLDDDEGHADGGLGLATEASFLAAAGQQPTWLLERQQDRHSKSDDDLQLEDWLSVLTFNEKRVMLMYYGVTDVPSSNSSNSSNSSSADVSNKKQWANHVSAAVVARQVGLTQARVQQIRNEALRKLQLAAQASNSSLVSGSSGSSRNSSAAASMSSSRDEEAESQAAAEAEAVSSPCSFEELPPAVAAAIMTCAPRARTHLRLVYHVYSQQGDLPTGRTRMHGIKLGQYCKHVLHKHRKGRLQPNIAAAFEVIAPRWLATASAALEQRRQETAVAVARAAASGKMVFAQYYPALQQYVQERGRMPEVDEVYNELQLGKWVHRERWRRKYMAEKKRQAFEQLPGWRWPRSKGQ